MPAMFELDLLCFDEPFRFDLKTMRRCASAPRAIVLVGEVDRSLAGFVIVHLRRHTADVVTLDVHPDCRRQGLAGALMEAAEGEGRERRRPVGRTACVYRKHSSEPLLRAGGLPLRSGRSQLLWCRAPRSSLPQGAPVNAHLPFAEDIAHAADLCAYAPQLFFDALVAAIHMVNAVEDGFTIGDKGGENERRRCAEIGTHHRC